jgi:hypothetical protein
LINDHVLQDVVSPQVPRSEVLAKVNEEPVNGINFAVSPLNRLVYFLILKLLDQVEGLVEAEVRHNFMRHKARVLHAEVISEIFDRSGRVSSQSVWITEIVLSKGLTR